METKSKAYRVYVTDALKCIAENTAACVQGAYMQVRYLDMIVPKQQEQHTAEEIKSGILRKLDGGGEVR